MDSDDEQPGVEELICTRCYCKLNHELYDIKSHPLLSVALCITCFIHVSTEYQALQKRGGLGEDTCSWCLDAPGGDVLVCGDGSACKHQFCQGCIRENLGEEYLQDLLEDDGDWTCFCCQPSRALDVHSIQLSQGQANSVYTRLLNDYHDNENDDDFAVRYSFTLLGLIVRAQNYGALQADEEYEKCIAFVGEELRGSKKSEELDLLKAAWKKHLEILQAQEKLLDQILVDMDYGYLTRELHEEIIKQEELNGPRNNAEKFFRIAEDDKLRSPSAVLLMQNDNSQEEEENEVVSDGENTDDGGSHTAFDLATVEAECDPLVQKFSEYPDIDLDKLPPAFFTKAPVSVLKALYHCTSTEETEKLIETYGVPRYIAVVMRYADEKFPESVMEWSFAPKLHKAVLQALYFAKTPLEHAILGSRYTIIPEDILEVTVIEEDVDNMTKVMERKGMTDKSVRIAEEEEKRSDMEHLKRVRKESSAKYKATGKSEFRNLVESCDRLLKRRERDVSSDDDESEAPQMDAVFPQFKAILAAKRKVKASSKAACSSREQPPFQDSDDATTDGIVETKKVHDDLVFSDDEDEEEKEVRVLSSKKKPLPAVNSSSPSRTMQTSNRRHASSPLLTPPVNNMRMDIDNDAMDVSAEEIDQAAAVDDDDDDLISSPHESDTSASDKITSAKNKEKETTTPAASSTEKSSSSSSSSSKKTGVSTAAASGTLPSLFKNMASSSSSAKKATTPADDIVDLTGDDDEEENEEVMLNDLEAEFEDGAKDSSSAKEPKKSSASSSKQPHPSTGKAAASNSKGGGTAFGSPKKFQFSKETREANLIEKQRLQELNAYNYFPSEGGMVINEKRPVDDPPITLFHQFVESLKPHQVEGVKFLWENIMKSVTAAGQKSKETYGCIIAHCMGLGKTFTVISFIVTLLTNPIIRKIKDPYHTDSADVSALNQDSQRESLAAALDDDDRGNTDGNEKHKRLLHRILVVAPRNVVENWEKEFRKWTPYELLSMLNITTIVSASGKERMMEMKIEDWFVHGGILIMSYDQFRLLVDEERNGKKGQASIDKTVMMRKYLQNPGPDLIIADEAHLIKNSKSKINEAMTMIHTRRRIALTGTPVQNHLEEYWCMVEWVKKRFLYSMKEYKRLFMDPIKKGEAKDALSEDIKAMKKRSHVLHQKLTPIVHRKDASELTKFLNKREFILTVRMSDFQRFLYKLFLVKLQEKGKFMLFRAYQSLMRVWNHPLATVIQSMEEDYKTQGGRQEPQQKARALSPELKQKLRSLDFLGKQVQGTYNYFQIHGKSTMQLLERQADRTEANLLKDTPAKNALTSSSSTGKKKKRKGKKRRAADDTDDDLEEEIDIASDSDNDDSDQEELDEDQEEDDDEGTDGMNDFVVDDDVIEYDDDHSGSEDEDGIKKPSSTQLRKRKRLRKSDEHDKSSSSAKRRRSMKDCDDDDDDDDDDDSVSSPNYFQDEEGKIAAKPASKQKAKKLKKKSSAWEMDTDDDDDDDFVDEDEDGEEAEADEHTETTDMTESKSMDTLHTAADIQAMLEEEMDVDDNGDPLMMQKPAASSSSAAAVVKTVSPAGDQSSPTNIAAAAATNATATSSSNAAPIINDADVTKAEDLTNEDEDPDEISSFWWRLADPSGTLSAEAQKELTALKPKDMLGMSHKMFTALALLALCVEQEEKVLIFSQSLYALNLIEIFLMQNRWGEMVGVPDEDMIRYSHWRPGRDFLRIDGSVKNRQELIDQFNDSRRKQVKLMLISTKAGNMGINLQAANRVIIFDCSWNPVHDVQAIFRSFRVGQTKDVFVYRLVAAGSMEEKIYKRQVTKQQTAARVVDAQMPNNQFTDQERMELMQFNDDSDTPNETVFEVVNSGTKDYVLSRFLETFGTQYFSSIENHDSYLEDVKEAHLDEEEKKNAEAELLLEIDRMRNPPRMPSLPPAGYIGTVGEPIMTINEDFHIAAIREFYSDDYTFKKTVDVINRAYGNNRTIAYCFQRYLFMQQAGWIERMKLNPEWGQVLRGFEAQQQLAAQQRQQQEYLQRMQQRVAQAQDPFP